MAADRLDSLGAKVFRSEHLTNLSLALPARPVFLVKSHEADRPFNRFLLRFQLKLRVAADDFLGLGERPVGHGHLPSGEPDASAQRSWSKPSAPEHRATGLNIFFGENGDCIHKLLGWQTLFLGMLNYHHEFHRQSP